jgi:hypothetical protein
MSTVALQSMLKRLTLSAVSNSNFGFAQSWRLPIDTDLATVGFP